MFTCIYTKTCTHIVILLCITDICIYVDHVLKRANSLSNPVGRLINPELAKKLKPYVGILHVLKRSHIHMHVFRIFGKLLINK